VLHFADDVISLCFIASVKTILGYQPQELLGKSVYDFYHAEDQLQMKETFEQGRIILMPFRISIDDSFCWKKENWLKPFCIEIMFLIYPRITA